MGKQRVKFTFTADMVQSPVIYELGHKFQVVTNIRRADVRENVGWVVLELEGSEGEIEKGVEWVSTQGIRVDPVAGDIIEG